VPITDTSPEIREMQFRILKEMPDEQRSRIALEMIDFARAIAEAGIRSVHPDWTERRIMLEILRRALWPQPLPAQLR
jgi:NADPH-dependent ferric siderophore reductase